MQKYREKGAAAFEDKREDPHRIETEQERELRRLQMEVDVLKSGRVADRYVVIDELKHKQTIKDLCTYLGVCRRDYYAYLKRKDKDPDADWNNEIVGYERADVTTIRLY